MPRSSLPVASLVGPWPTPLKEFSVRHWLLSAALACAPAFASAEEPALDVVASFSILGDMARQVGGDRIALKVLVGPDSDAHAYEPRPSDAMALARADVILTNGLELEGFWIA